MIHGVSSGSNVCSMRDNGPDNKTDGPGGATNAVTPGLTLDKGGLMANTMPPASGITEQAR